MGHVQIYQPLKLKYHFGDGQQMYSIVNNKQSLEKSTYRTLYISI